MEILIMKLDRAKFLLLATTIATATAAGGCIIVAGDGDGDSDSDSTTQSTDDTDSSTDGGSGTDASGTETDGGSSTDDGTTEMTSAGPGGTTSTTTEPGTTSGTTGGLECLGDDAGALSCEDVPPDCDDWMYDACVGAVKVLKTGVAEGMIQCLADDLCTSQDYYTCIDWALDNACADEAAVADCETITAGCATADMAECEQTLAGMNGDGRAAMVACMSDELNCEWGLFSCVESL